MRLSLGKNTWKIEYSVHIPFSEIRIADPMTRDHLRPIDRDRSDIVLRTAGNRSSSKYLFLLRVHTFALLSSFFFFFLQPRISRRDLTERRCPAAKIPEGDFPETPLTLVSFLRYARLRRSTTTTILFFLFLLFLFPPYFRFHPLGGPLSLFLSATRSPRPTSIPVAQRLEKTSG